MSPGRTVYQHQIILTLRCMRNLYLQNNLIKQIWTGQINSSKTIENQRKFMDPKARNTFRQTFNQRISRIQKYQQEHTPKGNNVRLKIINDVRFQYFKFDFKQIQFQIINQTHLHTEEASGRIKSVKNTFLLSFLSFLNN